MNDTASSTPATPEYHLPREMGKLAGYNLLCSEFNLGTEQFDVCGAIVLRMGTAAYAGEYCICL